MLQPPRRATAHGPGDGTATIHAPAEPLRARRRVALLPWILALAWLAATAWMRPLALPDEGRYVGVAWEMLRSGQWAVPTLDGMPFFHKPPLFYWITAASMAVFGPGVLAARAASLLGALIAAVSVALFVQRWQGERASRRVQIVLLTTPLFFGGAQFANLDMLVAGCISAAIVLAAHALLCLERGRPGRGALAGAFVFAALGMLAKGLIGGVLPALV
ncbi:MAG TPA: glycosyltransferase family 39 protein, partial [Albitalea sp.]|nr:glycosyltransferase family 39 protein [Albitalea sp.]